MGPKVLLTENKHHPVELQNKNGSSCYYGLTVLLVVAVTLLVVAHILASEAAAIKEELDLLQNRQKLCEIEVESKHRLRKRDVCTCLPGLPGILGRRGLKGSKGLQGIAGNNGTSCRGVSAADIIRLVGAKGEPGLDGPPGFPGPWGEKGDRGYPCLEN